MFTCAHQQNILNHDLYNLNYLEFEKPGKILNWLSFIRLLIEEHKHFYIQSLVSIIIRIFNILFNFPGSKKKSWRFLLVLIHPSSKAPWQRITKILRHNQIQTDPIFNDIYIYIYHKKANTDNSCEWMNIMYKWKRNIFLKRTKWTLKSSVGHSEHTFLIITHIDLLRAMMQLYWTRCCISPPSWHNSNRFK